MDEAEQLKAIALIIMPLALYHLSCTIGMYLKSLY